MEFGIRSVKLFFLLNPNSLRSKMKWNQSTYQSAFKPQEEWVFGRKGVWCTSAYAYVYMEPKGQIWSVNFGSGEVYVYSETGSLRGTWSLPARLGCLASEPQGSSCLLPNMGLQSIYSRPSLFHGCCSPAHCPFLIVTVLNITVSCTG